MHPFKVRLWRTIVPAIGVASLCAAAPTPPPVSDPVALNALTVAIRTLASERAGFTAFHRHVSAQERAPGHNASLEIQAGLLRDGDRAVAVRIYSRVADGTTASADDLAKAQADADKNPDDGYVLPLRADEIADYRIQNAPCDRCAPGNVAIAFTSLKRDPSHGDGTLVIEGATHHVLHVDFVPSALPNHVDNASVALKFGRVLPDLWDAVEMHEHYAGHVLFISGGAEIVTTYSGYRRFPSRDEGVKALVAGI